MFDDDEKDDERQDRRHSARRSSDHYLRVDWRAVTAIVAICIALSGGIVSWSISNAQEVRRMSERLATLESQRTEDVRRSERIERSVDRVEDKMDQVLATVRSK